MRQVLRDESIDAGYEEPGHLALAASEAVLDGFHREVTARPANATPLHVIDHSACEDLLHTRIHGRFLGGRWMPLAGVIHPARFLYGLAAAAIRRGGTVASRAGVLRVRRGTRGDGWHVRTLRGDVRARHVVLACNAKSARLWRPLSRVITSSRGQVLATRPLKPLFRPGMAVDYGALYWRQTRTGQVILGGYHDLDAATERTAREALNPRIQQALEEFLPTTFPEIPRVGVARRWAGIMDATPDGRPVVGPLSNDTGLWIAAGFGGHGLPPAIGIGRALARAIVEGERPAELDSLSPGRFREARAC
jgi:glycine/D-amino acid oxidase-like deaminating enzyme